MKDFLTKIWNKNIDILKYLLIIFSIAFIVYIFPDENKFSYEYSLGKPWFYEDLIAPFDFPVLKTDEEIAEEKQNIINSIHPFFRYETAIVNDKRIELKDKLQDKKFHFLLSVFDSIYSKGIIESADIIKNKNGDFIINLIKNNSGKEISINNIFTIKQAYNLFERNINNLKPSEKETCSKLMQDILVVNVFFDNTINSKVIIEKTENIVNTSGMLQAGEKILSKGELITLEKYNILNSLKRQYLNLSDSTSEMIFQWTGRSIIVAFAIFLIILYIAIFRKKVFADNKKILLILVSISFMLFVASRVTKIQPDMVYLIPFCILPIIIRGFFDSHLSFFVYIITVLLAGFIVPESFQFITLQIFAGTITLLSIINLQKRVQFFSLSIFVFISYLLIYLATNLVNNGNLNNISQENIWLFAGNAVLTIFAYPILFILEKSFGLISDVSLIELSGSNTKLLRELLAKAPGTFQHSLQVANLAEEAAFEIGGNPLLARTGAMYHDIGKIYNPLYFTENQIAEINPHNDLPFSESAEIIIGHILNGIRLARKNKLPEEIIDFIRTHHGTTKTRYFYTMYKKSYIQDELIDSELFTYHGPIPFSKETAIVMLADSVEAAAKSLNQPKEDDIYKLVDNVIDTLISENQLLNSDITLKDINTIRKLFKRQLLNMFHIRIKYPEL
ncbi:MAG: HDIG domain-containing protein [Bacteroidales bacterium]|nr:HDIG domain-containing protein [Bacteroidales bacterium]